MSAYPVAFFLIIYGISVLFHPDIPVWVTGLLAFIAGIWILCEKRPWAK